MVWCENAYDSTECDTSTEYFSSDTECYSTDTEYEENNTYPAILHCVVASNLTLESGIHVTAIPDSGCDITTISEDITKKIGVRVLRTQTQLLDATGARIELAGQSVIYVKVAGVSTKRLKVVVEKNQYNHLTISYRDLITLRVLAPNFPNQVNDLEAPLLPHPNGNPSTTPLLPCTVYMKKRIIHQGKIMYKCHVNAVPDSGCSGGTFISKSFACRTNIDYVWEGTQQWVANNTIDKILGYAFITIEVDGIAKMPIHRKVAVVNICDDMLLSWGDLIALGVLPDDFPNPAPE